MRQTAKILTFLGLLGFPLLTFADLITPSPAETIGSILIFFVINLVVNSVIIFALISRDRFKKLFRGPSLLKILLVTALGLVADFIGILCVSLLYTSDFTLGPLLILGFIIWILVALNFYLIYSREISDQKKTRIIKAIVFGFISNPFWLSLPAYLASIRR